VELAAGSFRESKRGLRVKNRFLFPVPIKKSLGFLISQAWKYEVRISCGPRLCLGLTQSQAEQPFINSKPVREFRPDAVFDSAELCTHRAAGVYAD